MFLLILEDSTPVLKETIDNNDRTACDFGYLDIYDLRDGNSVWRYLDGLWENVEPE